MTNKPGRKSQRTNTLRRELILGRTSPGDKVICSVSLRHWNAIAAIENFNYKKEYSYDRCPNPIYFNIPLLIIYLSAFKTLICHTDIDVNRIYFLRFCTKYLTRISKYGIELIVAVSSTRATKMVLEG